MNAFKSHLPEYLMEAAELGIFMISAGVFTCLFEYPESPFHLGIANGDLRRFLIGIFMGLTATALIYSPWGKQSGAHMNPAVTLTFYRLGKVTLQDALFYILFQCLGGLAGVLLVAQVLKNIFTQPPVQYVITVPGASGWLPALGGELSVAVLMMLMVLFTSNHEKLKRFTGVFAGCLVMLYVTFEAPLSGFGMNPARTFASALPAGIWTAFWIYLFIPPLGMLLASEIYGRIFNRQPVKCAKLIHAHDKRCIFCGKPQMLISKQ